ncbi:Uu.00g098060.m01.CDS01 [Anthostomella pinea]|uniref:Uu.00g098060.m01.CDS01 n=1 Tax=Anthostomella pinea TaxID=933095 RepID=A0AAI8YF41_9PEZI|nr:Uu.00g098060.m01.CDS01 [Anthostomella pinea]
MDLTSHLVADGGDASIDHHPTLRSLTFQLQIPEGEAEGQQWSHKLYRRNHGQAVEVVYSTTLNDSEQLAQLFIGEEVLGFDMGWVYKPMEPKWQATRLQEKVSVIQLAAEDKIGIFDVARHVGKTTQQLIAPTLQKIIEDPGIVKTGVNILNADFARLEKHFDLKPQGDMELSHLHMLVTYRPDKPHRLYTSLVR